MTRATATTLMAGAAGSWGVATVTSKLALGQLAATDLFLVEVVTGTVVVWTALLATGGITRPPDWRRFVALGLLEPGLSFVLFDLGLSHTGAADSAILVASDSVIAALLAWAVLGEGLTRRFVVALAVGMTGSVLVTLHMGGGSATLLGDLLVLGAAATAAAYSVAARGLQVDGSPPLTATAIQLLTATVVAVPLGLAAAAGGHSHLAQADAGHLLEGCATGAFGAALPFLLFNAAIRHVTVVGSALTVNLVPLVASGLAVAFLGEQLGALQLAGGALVMGAAAVSSA